MVWGFFSPRENTVKGFPRAARLHGDSFAVLSWTPLPGRPASAPGRRPTGHSRGRPRATARQRGAAPPGRGWDGARELLRPLPSPSTGEEAVAVPDKVWLPRCCPGMGAAPPMPPARRAAPRSRRLGQAGPSLSSPRGRGGEGPRRLRPRADPGTPPRGDVQARRGPARGGQRGPRERQAGRGSTYLVRVRAGGAGSRAAAGRERDHAAVRCGAGLSAADGVGPGRAGQGGCPQPRSSRRRSAPRRRGATSPV